MYIFAGLFVYCIVNLNYESMNISYIIFSIDNSIYMYLYICIDLLNNIRIHIFLFNTFHFRTAVRVNTCGVVKDIHMNCIQIMLSILED